MSGPLTDTQYWNKTHPRLVDRGSYPQPRRHLMDCELDRCFRKYIAPPRCGSIVEVGCGSSRWLPYFARELGLRVVGIDYSEPGLLNARRNLERHGAVGELINNDLFRQAETDQPRVDSAFSLGLLEHFSGPEAALGAISRFVKPGGIVISLVPNVPGLILRLSCRLNPGLTETYSKLDLDAWLEVHRRCGLEIIEGDYAQFFDWTWLNLTRFSRPSQVWVSRVFRLLVLPLVAVGRRTGRFVHSRTLGASLIIVARKPVG